MSLFQYILKWKYPKQTRFKGNELFKLNEFVISFLFFRRLLLSDTIEGDFCCCCCWCSFNSTNGFHVWILYKQKKNHKFNSISSQFCYFCWKLSHTHTVHIPLPISNQYTFTLLLLDVFKWIICIGKMGEQTTARSKENFEWVRFRDGWKWWKMLK